MTVTANRLVVTARLKPGAADAAAELLAKGPPFDPEELGFHRHTVFRSAGELVFVFEAPQVEWAVRELADDPAVAAVFAEWAPLFEEPPRVAQEEYHWERLLQWERLGLGL